MCIHKAKSTRVVLEDSWTFALAKPLSYETTIPHPTQWIVFSNKKKEKERSPVHNSSYCHVRSKMPNMIKFIMILVDNQIHGLWKHVNMT